MIPDIDTLIAQLSEVRPFTIASEFKGFDPKKIQKLFAESGRVKLEIIGDKNAPTTVNLVVPAAEDTTEHFENSALLIQLLSAALPEMPDSPNWLIGALAAESPATYTADTKQAKLIKVDSVVILSVTTELEAEAEPESLVELIPFTLPNLDAITEALTPFSAIASSDLNSETNGTELIFESQDRLIVFDADNPTELYLTITLEAESVALAIQLLKLAIPAWETATQWLEGVLQTATTHASVSLPGVEVILKQPYFSTFSLSISLA